jgi:hypothetical protein
MIWRRSILLLVYGVGARSDVTSGVWRVVEKENAEGGDPSFFRVSPMLCSKAKARQTQ